jgi:hypothetical protein
MDSANRAGRSTMGAPVEDLAQWLGQQLDADERIARFVGVPHDWHQGPGDDPEWTDEALAHYERIRQHTRQGGEAYVLAEGAVAKQIQIMAVAYTDRPGYRESRRP